MKRKARFVTSSNCCTLSKQRRPQRLQKVSLAVICCVKHRILIRTVKLIVIGFNGISLAHYSSATVLCQCFSLQTQSAL